MKESRQTGDMLANLKPQAERCLFECNRTHSVMHVGDKGTCVWEEQLQRSQI